jgi:hypothetical protein
MTTDAERLDRARRLQLPKKLENVLLCPGELLQESPMRFRTFRSLVGALTGAFLIGGALVPRADAVLVTYFNFEDTILGNQFTTASSQPPGPTGITLTITPDMLPAPTSTQGVPLNVAPGDMVANLHGAGFVTTTGGSATLSFTVSTANLTNFSLSFAVNNNGNGFSRADFYYNVGGTTLGTFAGFQTIHTGAKVLVSFDYSAFTAVNDQPSVTFSVVLSGGTSMGSNLETIVDNIQLNATPEPTTTATGALAILGLCWYRRRWLIRFLRRI